MGQQVSKRPVKKRNWKQQARIQGLYEMYTQSIRLSTLIKNNSIIGDDNDKNMNKATHNKRKNNNNKSKKQQSQKNQSQKKKSVQQWSRFLQQLLQSFSIRNQFSWSQQIPQLFNKHFREQFGQKWQQSKQFFYELLLENVGVNVQGEELVGKSRIGGHNNDSNSFGNGFHKQGSRIVVVDDNMKQHDINKNTNTNNNNRTLQSLIINNNTNNNNKTNNKITTFQQYFHQIIIKQRSSMNIHSSFLVNDDQIDRRKEEQIAEVQSQRMTLEQEINFINSSIIDAQQGYVYQQGLRDSNNSHQQYSNINVNDHNINQNNNNHTNVGGVKEQDNDEYFLPLITKRHKHNKKHKNNKHKELADRISQQSQSAFSQHEIEISHLPSTAKYSRLRLQTSSVILPSTIFYERMNFTAKVQTDQSLRIYRQLSNTIQQTINSCNLISCPLKHFLLYFQYKTAKKKIGQVVNNNGNNSGVMGSIVSEQSETLNNKGNKSADSMKNISVNNNGIQKQKQKTNKSSPFIAHQQSNTLQSSKNNNNKSTNKINKQQLTHQHLYQILTQVSQKSQIISKKRQFNTNYLLKQVKQFAQSYTQFLYKYLNFDQIQSTDLSAFINLDTVYGIVLRNIWNIVNWIADRGYQWEEFALVEVVDNQNPLFQTFTQNEIEQNPSVILRKYASFCNKDVKKIKTDPVKLCRAYSALMKLKNQVFPQKYLKKIIIFYRQATKCCQGADDLMTLYEFLLKNCILNNFAQEMHIFRMKNIIQRLIPIESSAIDGAGEIVYAWTTWNIILQMFNIKLNEHKKVLLAENEKKTAIYHLNRVMTQKKKNVNNIQQQQKQPHNQQQQQTSSTAGRKEVIKNKNQLNPERRVDRKLQFTLTQCHQVQK